MTKKKCITSYDRKNIDWGYINYLENLIKEMKSDHIDLYNEFYKIKKENNVLKSKLQYYKNTLF